MSHCHSASNSRLLVLPPLQVETGNATCEDGTANATTVAAAAATTAEPTTTTTAIAGDELCLDLDAYSQATSYAFCILGSFALVVGALLSALRGNLRLRHIGAE